MRRAHVAVMLAVVAAVSFLTSCYRPVRPSEPTHHIAHCASLDPGQPSRWRHRIGAAAVATLFGDPHHAASDPVVNPGQDASVRGKFAYGPTSKDLEGEDVGLWLRMRPCGPWQEIVRGTTDNEGRLTLKVPADIIRTVGSYDYQLIVRGDLSRAHGMIYVVTKGTPAVVFDIDGTLTKGDSELAKQLGLGSDPAIRAAAAQVANLYVRGGFTPVYITGRPYMLRESSRMWLHRKGLPQGILITTATLGESLPWAAGVGQFKTNALRRLQMVAGMKLAFAYGNAGTDICAYAQAGIVPAATFIVGKHGGVACGRFDATQPLKSFRTHLKKLLLKPPDANNLAR